MDFTPARIKERIRAGEDSRCEFKQIEFSGSRLTCLRRDDLADEIAAFANARGGVLLCGVTDQRTLQGLSNEEVDRLDTVIGEICSDVIKPAVQSYTFQVVVDEKLVLVVEVAEGESLHESPGGGYTRLCNSKRRMNSVERQRLSQRRGERSIHSFDEKTVANTELDSLEESIWLPLLTSQGAKSPTDSLRKLGLLSVDNFGISRATVGGVLLCTRNPERWLPNALIKATRYQGLDRASGQLDARTITGPLNKQIAESIEFAIKNMRVAARKDPARIDMPQYSKKAIFEAVVNAVAHRDYSIRGSSVRLSMFEDRLEIESPGSLPNTLTVDTIDSRQFTRNNAVVSILGKMPVGDLEGAEDREFFVETRGDGVPIIKRETRALTGRLPQYQLIDESVLRLTIPSAPQDLGIIQALIAVWSNAKPLPNADVLVVYPNGSRKRTKTTGLGEARADLHSARLPLSVFVAARGHAAHLERDWVPAERVLGVELKAMPKGGSIIFPEGSGSIPGLRGRLSIYLDSHGRTFLNAWDLTVNRGKPQPIHVVHQEDLKLTDAVGRRMLVQVVDVASRSALVEYRPDSDPPE